MNISTNIIKKEIERKFLVKKPFLPEYLYTLQCVEVKQGYLNQHSDSIEVKAKNTDDKKYELLIKDMGNKVRNEITLKITEVEWQVIWSISNPKHIVKKSYDIPIQKGKLTYDVYEDKLSGLIIAEFECDDEQIVDNFKPLDWMGEEITDVDSYKGRTLSIFGVPELHEENFKKIESILNGLHG